MSRTEINAGFGFKRPELFWIAVPTSKAPLSLAELLWSLPIGQSGSWSGSGDECESTFRQSVVWNDKY